LAAYDSSVSKASGAAMFLTTTRANSTVWVASSASRSGAVADQRLSPWAGGLEVVAEGLAMNLLPNQRL
jgi:hypothetical protein